MDGTAEGKGDGDAEGPRVIWPPWHGTKSEVIRMGDLNDRTHLGGKNTLESIRFGTFEHAGHLSWCL